MLCKNVLGSHAAPISLSVLRKAYTHFMPTPLLRPMVLSREDFIAPVMPTPVFIQTCLRSHLSVYFVRVNFLLSVLNEYTNPSARIHIDETGTPKSDFKYIKNPSGLSIRSITFDSSISSLSISYLLVNRNKHHENKSSAGDIKELDLTSNKDHKTFKTVSTHEQQHKKTINDFNLTDLLSDKRYAYVSAIDIVNCLEHRIAYQNCSGCNR
ncbi:hypothetical protein [Sulfurovum sp.]|uniref:hypothetical protein n=1 Tax=Sulfurovum sp. TaxID=1969726 RepID=UPI0035678090